MINKTCLFFVSHEGDWFKVTPHSLWTCNIADSGRATLYLSLLPYLCQTARMLCLCCVCFLWFYLFLWLPTTFVVSFLDSSVSSLPFPPRAHVSLVPCFVKIFHNVCHLTPTCSVSSSWFPWPVSSLERCFSSYLLMSLLYIRVVFGSLRSRLLGSHFPPHRFPDCLHLCPVVCPPSPPHFLVLSVS